MGMLWKLCWRDLMHRKLRLGFTILAIAAVSCLMIWFVGSLDLSSMMKRDVVKKTFGEYSLALFRDDGFSADVLTKLEKSALVERLDRAWQTDPDVTLKGVTFAAAAFKRSPKITGTDRVKSAPYELEEGRWLQKPGECVVSSTAESDLLGGTEREKQHVLPGDELLIKTDVGESTLTVVGTFRQTAMKPQTSRFPARGSSFGTFSFGFGQGLGVSGAPKPSAAPNASKGPDGPQSPKGAGAPKGSRGPKGAGVPDGQAGRNGQAGQNGQTGPMPPMEEGGRRKAIRGPWSPQGVGLSAGAVYVSLEDQQKMCGRQGMINLVFVTLKKGKTSAEFFAEAEKALGKSLDELVIEHADAATLQSEQDQQQSVNSVFAQAWSAMGIVIVTAILIIFTTLNMDVSERTRCLAMLRTLGLTRAQVAGIIMLEGLLLGVLGWLLGMLAGWGLLEYLAFSSEGEWIFLPLSAANVLVAFVCTLAGAFLASIVPALRATFVSPVESMVRKNRRFAMKDLFMALLIGVILLGAMPMIVFLPMKDELRGLLFGTLGTFCFGIGFLLVFPWTIAVTEKLGAPILAFLFRFNARFLRNQLAGNQVRTLMTALIMALGLGLFTAILIWSSSMLYRFVIQDGAIPFALVRIDDVITSDQAASALRAMPGVDETQFMEVAVAQPELDGATARKMQEGGAMSTSVVVMGIDPKLAWSARNPMLNLRFVEGNREDARQALTEAASNSQRACVVTTELSEHGGLHPGDFVRLALPGSKENPEFASYRIVGVVDFPGMLWFTKFGNVRVGAGRCCALAFAPGATVQADFQTPANEFFWFNTDGKTSHNQLRDSLQEIVHREAAKNFLPETDAEFSAAKFAAVTNSKEAELAGLPDVLAALHPGAATRDAAFAIRETAGTRSDDVLYVNSTRASLTGGGAAILYGIDPQIAFRTQNPTLNLTFSAGSAADALRVLCDDRNSCVVTSDFAAARNLKPGDRITLNLPQEASPASGPGMGGPGQGKPGTGAGSAMGGPGMGGKPVMGGPGQGKPGMGAGSAMGGPGMGEKPTMGGPGQGKPGMGGPGMGSASSTIELTIAAVVDLPNWQTLAERTGSQMRQNVQTVIFTTVGVVKDDFRAKEFQNYWFPLEPSASFANVNAAIQAVAKASAEKNRETDALARRTMLRQMQGAQIATVESVNGSLGARAGSVIGMMTKMPLIMLAISTIAILNTMIVSVFTRRWEMGVLRACGVTRGGLVRLILSESVLIGFCAIVMSFLFGVFYSWLLIHVTSMFGIVTPPLIIPWSKIGTGFGLAVLICVAASLYPAFVTGLKEPVQLLQRKN